MARSKKPGPANFIEGLGSIIEKLARLAEAGQELQKTGEMADPTGKLKGIWGFNVRTGAGGKEGVHVEPFGNVRQDARTGKVSVHEVREPAVDVMDEDRYVLVLVEMPGIASDEVRLDLKDDVLTVDARHGPLKYHKEILLPMPFERERMESSCRNGILEIRLNKDE